MTSRAGSASVFRSWFAASRSYGAPHFATSAVAIVALACSAPPPPNGCGHGVIDTMEDGDDEICPVEGRIGDWYTFNDGTGTQTPPTSGEVAPARIAGGRGASHFAMHTFGDGCTG